jgi:Transglutaminase-like superfamily
MPRMEDGPRSSDSRPVQAARRHDFRYPQAEGYRNFPARRISRFLCSPFVMATGDEAAEWLAMDGLLTHLVALGLPYRQDAQGERLFDLAETVNFIKYAHHAFGDPTWRARSVAQMRLLMQLGAAPTVGTEAPLPPVRSGRHVAVTITRRFAADHLRPGRPIRLFMPKPLNACLESHEVQWLALPEGASPPVDEGSRYSLKLPSAYQGPLHVAVRHVFRDAGHIPGTEDGASLDTQAQALYTRRREGLICVTPEIECLAQRLGLSAAAPAVSLRRIWDYLFHEISFGFIHYDRLCAEDPLRWCLAHRRVDCRTGSALMAALCRAVGIPARLLHGYTLHPAAPTAHTWLQAWIAGKGWSPFDTYAVDLAGGATDSPWRDYYFGQIDDRFVAECPPLAFCGLGTPRLPAHWQLCLGVSREGATTWYEEVGTRRPIYEETVASHPIADVFP